MMTLLMLGRGRGWGVSDKMLTLLTLGNGVVGNLGLREEIIRK